MRPGTLIALFAAVSLNACIATPIDRSAPIRAVNQHPVQLTAIHAPARAARVPEAGEAEADLRVDWTSHWLLEGRGADAVTMDGETIRAEVDVRVGLGHDLDLEVGLPFMWAGGGRLDRFVEAFHDIFTFPQSGRDKHPRNRYGMVIERAQPGGALADAYRLDDGGFRLGDVPVFLTWLPYREEGLSLGLRGGIELPTGSERDGYGNGGVDLNLGFLGGYDAPGYSLFFWGSHSFVAQADRARDAGLDYEDVTAVGVGAQFALSERFSALVQLEFETSVLRNLDETHADKPQLHLWTGARYRVSETVDLEVALGEGLILDVSPDFTLHLGVKIRF